MTNVKVCQLCFAKDGDNCYVLSTSSLHDFLNGKAQETPFLQRYLKDVSGKLSSFFLCVLCDSWVRRQSHLTKVLLSVDRFILSILFPGHPKYKAPEMRTSIRICTSLLREDNHLLRSLCPAIVIQTCMKLQEEKIFLESRHVTKNLSYAVWQCMGKPFFLSNAQFAKSLRCVRKIRNESN